MNNKIITFASICRNWILAFHNFIFFRCVYSMNVSKFAKISLKARLDKNFPEGVYIDEFTYIAAGSVILTHDHVYTRNLNTRIGKNCFIGMNSLILPGVSIGDECIIGAGSVVVADIPSHCLAVGNPAIVKRRNLSLGKYGVITEKNN